MSACMPLLRRWRLHAAGLTFVLAAYVGPAAAAAPQNQLAHERMLIVALADKPDPAPTVGSTPRGYGGLPNYAGSTRSSAGAARLARDYGLREVSAWTIKPLRLRCMVYEIPASAERAEMIERLQRDDRVRLAQPLQSFDTLTTPNHDGAAPPASDAPAYNDPYVGLQRGFSAIGADRAQRWSSGTGVRVALIDTGVDAQHPDLRGRIATQRDFVDAPAAPPGRDRHGTEVAGVIAAVANNRVGIAGVAPGARVFSYRACWSTTAGAGAARCNSYTLALALGAAIDADAQIINLSLGGPADPLLEQLAGHAVEHGAIVIGAVPPDRHMDGFPLNVPGVIAVTEVEDPAPDRPALAAPGREILTLEPDGHYDYASGSSLAAAHVSGSVALLLQLAPRLRAREAFALLGGGESSRDGSIDVCAAMLALGRAGAGCSRLSAAAVPRRAAARAR